MTMAEKHIDPTLLKEALANVEKRIDISLVNLTNGVETDMDRVVAMFTVRDILRKEQFARP
jgi:hypothetical protein